MRDGKIEKLIITAKSLAGRPYKYGAELKEAPRCFDCSGFIQYVYKKIGIKLPRCAVEQAEKGRLVKNKKSLKPGDLIFFRGERGHYKKKLPGVVGQVAMYLGNDRIIHASSKRIRTHPKIVESGGVKIEPLAKILKRKDIIAIKRILR